ncbi:unnamed protein product [Medioppia subpectinata]|uniref:non-specific serine/threonine protein kinase n=1 Tax=Medioppia subpectinata TaxID=1979941 RepID=A0A7R9L7S7_9ACAR|nr:unnamed protein product [Medioppia subpectinata]CAG2116003.1 unnamed protein product [Medioppia subpectinata]
MANITRDDWQMKVENDLVEDKGDYKKNINREVSILQNCEHVSVVKYYESWREHGKAGSDLAAIYIQMEHCPLDLYEFCGSIKNIYKRNTNQVICLVSYFVMLTMVEEILVALDYLHSKNIMHRDIKQWNILLKRDGDNWVKLSDFGLAKVEDAYSQTHTNVGTATYKAPEVKWGGHYTTSADVLSLGIMLIQFFDLDINKQNVHHELKDLFASMIAGKATERPTCKQALASISQPPLIYDLDKTSNTTMIRAHSSHIIDNRLSFNSVKHI